MTITPTDYFSGRSVTSPLAARWYAGEGAPDESLGDVGDMYLDLDASVGDVYARNRGGWEKAGSILGPTGPQGDPAPSFDTNAQTGTSYTLAASDAGKLVTLDNASAITLTVPPDASVEWEDGATIAIAQLGSGGVTIEEGSGVVIRSLGDALSLSGQYATASLLRLGEDEWLLSGGLA